MLLSITPCNTMVMYALSLMKHKIHLQWSDPQHVKSSISVFHRFWSVQKCSVAAYILAYGASKGTDL